MNRRQRNPVPSLLIRVALVTVHLWVASLTGAQDDEWRVVDNPYQEDIKYEIGDVFAPMVAIDGLRWRSLRIAPRDGENVAAGESVSIDVAVEFENRAPEARRVLVVLLLEESDGTPIDRLEFREFKIGPNRFRDRTQGFRLPGHALLSTRRVYAFCEITD
jgi:hypothetical protein